MACCVCNSEQTVFFKAELDRVVAWCRECSKRPYSATVDVAYPYGSGTHTEENIAYPSGHEKQGEPIPFSSKRGKLEAMKIAGVRESGDRIHGAINSQKPKKTYFV